jgi:hypothetical protein
MVKHSEVVRAVPEDPPPQIDSPAEFGLKCLSPCLIDKYQHLIVGWTLIFISTERWPRPGLPAFFV